MTTTNMAHPSNENLRFYEGDEDPKIHWFIYEKTWDAMGVSLMNSRKWNNLLDP